MGTLAENAAAVKAAQVAIDAAIVAKGGTTTGGLTNAAAAIAALPSGGGEWQPPSDWPNIRQMMMDDNGHGYQYMAYFLYCPRYYPTISFDYPYWRTSDGGEYHGNQTHSWVDSEAEYGWVAIYSNTKITIRVSESYDAASKRCFWMCFSNDLTDFSYTYCYLLESVESSRMTFTGGYGNRAFFSASALRKLPDVIDLSSCTSASQIFSGCYSLQRVPEVLDLSACTNANSMFNDCHNLQRVPEVLDFSDCTNASYMFNNCHNLQRVPEVLDLSACTNASYMFYNCYSLQRVPEVLDLSACTNANSMFSYCRMLQRVPEVLDLSACTNVGEMFRGCINLKRVPDVFNISLSTSNGRLFESCASLEALPTHLSANRSVAFNYSSIVSRDSVAVFTDGAITGGMVHNLNTCDTSGQTITFASAVKSMFSTEEWTAIKAALADRNWGCSPA